MFFDSFMMKEATWMWLQKCGRKTLKRWRLDHLGIGKVHQQNGKDQDWNL
jgi:hypothetical protein